MKIFGFEIRRIKSEPSFTVSFFCDNCNKASTHKFPHGSIVIRTRIVERSSKVRVPTENAPGWVQETVVCPTCGSTNVA